MYYIYPLIYYQIAYILLPQRYTSTTLLITFTGHIMSAKIKHNDQVLNIRIPTALYEQLKVVAETQYMPVSVMVRLALAEYVRTHATVALSRVAVNPQQPQPLPHNPNIPRRPSDQLIGYAEQDEWL